MATATTERRVYPVTPIQLFGICLTALAQLRALIERQDAEQGTISAVFSALPLEPASQLTLALRPLARNQTALAITWRARKRGGDQRRLAVFLEAVDALVRQA